jgi:hypothetical protein
MSGTSRYYGANHIFTSRTNNNNVSLRPGVGEILDIAAFQIDGHFQFVEKKEDFPEPVNGVITLGDFKVYEIIHEIDMEGLRFQCGIETVIIGTSPGTSGLSSTGLGVGVPFFTTTDTFIIREITIHDVDTFIDFKAIGTKIISFNRVLMQNIPNWGILEDCQSFSALECSFVFCNNIVISGTTGAVLLTLCNFLSASADPVIIIDSTAVIEREVKVDSSNISLLSSGPFLDLDPAAVIPNQGLLVFDSIFNESLQGSVSGVDVTSNIIFFDRNLGIENSRSAGGFHLDTSALTILNLNVWTKISGITAPSVNNSKFDHLDNRLTYIGNLINIFFVTYSVNLSGTNNNDIEIGVSINGIDPVIDTVVIGTLSAAGKIAGLSGSFFIQLKQNDYLELFCRNISASTDITAESLTMNVIE